MRDQAPKVSRLLTPVSPLFFAVLCDSVVVRGGVGIKSVAMQTIPSNDQQIITARGVVYPWQCDHMGHMNVMWYTGKFDEATWHLFGHIGLTPSYLRDQKRGMAGLQQETSYRRELFAGDLIVIRSEILEMREKVLRFHHEMLNADTGEIAATSTLVAAHINRETRKSCEFPTEILERGRRSIIRKQG